MVCAAFIAALVLPDARAAWAQSTTDAMTQRVALERLAHACGASAQVAQVSPGPSASPSASPTPLRIPPIQPGPGQLIPPTPQPYGTPTPSPPPLPTPTPTSSASSGPVYLVRPSGSPSPIPPKGASPSPTPSVSPSPSPSPVAIPTLGPNQIAILGDEISGSSKAGAPSDYRGNVHIFDADGTIVGDLAHYDGSHVVTVTGHTYIINRNADSILYADKIVYDSQSGIATLTNGHGESNEGVEQGKIHYSGRLMTMDRAGKVHAVAGSFTTCENQRGGYHVDSKTIDVTPGDKLIARKDTVFLGLLGVFFLPVLIIPLKQPGGEPRRQPSFVPEFGYDSADGFYVRARIGFGTTDYYYGYYRIEEYTRRGQAFGYVAYIGRRDNRRVVNIDTYFFHGTAGTGNQANANISDVENFSQHLRGQFNFVYTGEYGPLVSLPPSMQIGGSIIHQGLRSSENYQFSRSFTGSQSSSDNLAFIDQRQISPTLQQGINLSYTDYASAYPGQLSSTSQTLHIQSLTHLTSRAADYTLTFDKTTSNQPFGYDTVPALEIIPHLPFENARLPIQTTFTAGYYVEPQNHFATERADMNFIVGPGLFKVFRTSDLSAGFTVDQLLYGTGDEKANITQNLALTTPLSPHIVNAITYDEQNPIGPTIVPFQLLDQLSGGSHQAQDTLRIFNGDVYSLSLSTGTAFNRQAQPVLYQFTSRPSPRSALTISGSWNPGPGNGFYQTAVQVFTPFGYETELQFAANINWKSKGQIADKTIFYRKIIGECYDILASYNQDLKAFNLNFELLAFPGRTAGVTLAPNQPLLPTSFNY
ncbi:MAG: hypothetical protein JO060_00630 [Candidatus Eremiobacteraeota bacterium]|nr:hypothetical protein [Candidatus Eremiobacteraeota bacterium]MBV9647090.1 hypothetical protein [Candidatus Eremiobacteraeota bacterium]